jgi:hypothetical protein
MGDDEAKRVILARRAAFVAAALAGLSATMCGGQTDADPQSPPGATNDGGTPQPCLTPFVPDASSDADAAPQPCLAPLPPDAGDDGGDAGDGG